MYQTQFSLPSSCSLHPNPYSLFREYKATHGESTKSGTSSWGRNKALLPVSSLSKVI